MAKTKKRILYGLLMLLAVAVIAGLVYFNSLLPIITGYAAKNLCSAIFISGREQAEVESMDLNFSFIKKNKNFVDEENKSVTSRFLWGKSTAIYREGFGVTLLRDVKEEELRKVRFPSGTEPAYNQETIQWPLGNILPDSVTGINIERLNAITVKVMSDTAYKGNIYAFLVMHKGIPVAESYKPQFDKNTRFISWSMAKSFTNALTGILVRQGVLDINQPVGLEEWKDDDRSKITLKHLMQMQSGLEWNEDYGNRSDVTVMLHCEPGMGEYALKQGSGILPEHTGITHQELPTLYVILSSGNSGMIHFIIRLRRKSCLIESECLMLCLKLIRQVPGSDHHTCMPQPGIMPVLHCFT